MQSWATGALYVPGTTITTMFQAPSLCLILRFRHQQVPNTNFIHHHRFKASLDFNLEGRRVAEALEDVIDSLDGRGEYGGGGSGG